LNRYDIKYPIVDRAHHDGAFNNTYTVTVTTPEGCVYIDQVKITPGPQIFILPYNNPTYGDGVCGSESFGASLITVKMLNVEQADYVSFIDQSTGEVFQLNFDAANSVPNESFYSGYINREINHDLELDLSNFSIFNQCENCCDNQSGTCTIETNLYLPRKSEFIDPWVVYKPTAFSPNGDGYNDYFYLTNYNIFIQDQNDDCNLENFDQEKSSITYYKLMIFNRWGNKVYEGAVQSLSDVENGVDISEVKWDGKFNGYSLNPDVYTWTAEIHSCYSGSTDYDTHCNYPSEYETNNEEITNISGDVTLL